MAAANNAYSRFVFWLKVLLPIVALAILSTLFLVAETLDPNKAIPYAEVDVAQILREQGVTRPKFGGTTPEGATITLAADAVRPDGSDALVLRGTDLDVVIDLPSGTSVTIASPSGTVDFDGQSAVLTGGTELVSSLGYRIETDALTTALDRVAAQSAGPVRVTGPGVEIDAGQMILRHTDEQGAHVLVFKNGVRLLYDPKTSED